MRSLTLLLLLAAAARAQPGPPGPPRCFFLDTAYDPPAPAPMPCPGEYRYDDPMPPPPRGTVWIKRRGAREYWSEVLLRVDPSRFSSGPRALPIPADEPYALAIVHHEGADRWQVNPTASDYLTRALVEKRLGRASWAALYARVGLALAPGDARLTDLSRLDPKPSLTFKMKEVEESFTNGHRAGERGHPEEALLWLDHSIVARPTAQAFALKAHVLHALGRDAEALQSAESGLALAPNDLQLRSLRDDLSRVPAPAPQAPRPAAAPALRTGQQPAERAGGLAAPVSDRPPPEALPAPAAPARDDRPALFAVLGLLMLGAGGGYALARRHGAGKTTAAATIVDARALVGAANAPPVLKRYELRSRIGSGGMGVVYEAVERVLGRRVAIKQMRAEIKDGERERAAFLREAQIISELKHPAIVAFHEIIQEEGEIFLIFEFVDGKPLSELLAQRGRLPLEETRKIFAQVCEAVSCAHRAHVLHRDLKPSNIMVDKEGRVKVMDFGIARQAKDTITRLTRADASGTPAYMAPEQHLGTCAKASDIYSLGVCLYETLTGRLPFSGPDFLAQKERMKYSPPQLVVPSLPKETELLFKATLALNPEHRVADAEELIGSLRGLG